MKPEVKLKRLADKLKTLREFLSQPEQRDKFFSVAEILRRMKKSQKWFYESMCEKDYAEIWLELNPKAPLEERVRAANVKEHEVHVENGVVRIPLKKKGKKFRPPTEKTVENLKNLSKQVSDFAEDELNEGIKIIKREDEKSRIIERIRVEFIKAPIGARPDIFAIAVSFGILEEKTRKPLMGLTDEELLQAFQSEDWREERRKYIHRTWMIIEDEMNMLDVMQTHEAKQISFNQLKIQNRILTEFFTTGQVTIRDPKTGEQKVIDYEPDPMVIAALGETFRKLASPDLHKIALNFNQINIGSGGGSSQVWMKQFMTKLEMMSTPQIEAELQKLDKLRAMLRQDDKALLEEVYAQMDAIDVKKEPQT